MKGVNVMTYFKKTEKLTDTEKQVVGDMTGQIQLWLLEGRSLDYISEQLHLPPRMVMENMCETAHTFIKFIGGYRCYFFKWLIHKRHKR